MGTRHLTAVVMGGEYKIAQYGQWDGYPTGQGATVLEFLAKWKPKVFKAKLAAASFCTDEELKAIGEKFPSNWSQKFPQLSRDMGAEILAYVQEADKGVKLRNTIGFAGDSLFCEFAYVIDLDKSVLEVYRGFNKVPLEEGQRFRDMPGLEKCEGYEPIRMLKQYPLNQLPTVEQMEKDVCGEQGDD